MPDGWVVEITRTVRVEVPATCHADAQMQAEAIGWEWAPMEATSGQGTVRTCVLRAGDLPGDGGQREMLRYG